MPPQAALPVAVSIADYMHMYSWDSLPEPIQTESQRALLNYLGCTIGGAVTASVNAAVRGVKALDQASDTLVAGRQEKCGLSNAALLGALSASAHTFDDTHLATITHPTAPVASACLATSYRLSQLGAPVDGSTLLAAIASGIELQCRISNGIRAGGTASMGWYITGLSGGIGAAMAVGHLLKLDHPAFVSAAGLAATQACGLRATHGSMAIAYVPGLAAKSGVEAAFLAQAGFECSPIAIDGRNGLLQVLNSKGDAAQITKALGTDFELLNNAYKPYPCGIVIHPAIDGCLKIVRDNSVDCLDIDRIRLDVHPDAMTLTWRQLPDTELDAQVSLYHWVAAALVFKKAGIAEGGLHAIRDSRVRQLQTQTDVNVDEALKDNQARVTLIMKDGRHLVAEITNATGSVTNPMSTAQLVEKFRSLSEPVLGKDRMEATLDSCMNLPGATDASVVLRDAALAA